MTKIVAMIFVTLLFCEWSGTYNVDVNSIPKTSFEAAAIIGRLQYYLGRESVVRRSLFVITAIEEFVNRFLIPRYLLETAKSPLLIRSAYLEFLRDKNNETAVEISREIKSCGLTIQSFVQMTEEIYYEAGAAIHTCYDVHRVSENNHDNYLLGIRDVFTNITPLGRKILSIMDKFSPKSN